MDLYIREVLRISTGQILQTIGYNSIQSIPLEILIDSLHKFLQEFARNLHRHVELFNRTEANLDDVALCLHSLDFSVYNLLEYISHVQPVASNIEIPQLPAAKPSNLNFLKPGSKEVLSRPVHVYEHLPPMLKDSEPTSEDKHRNNTPSLAIINNQYSSSSTNTFNDKCKDGNTNSSEQDTIEIDIDRVDGKIDKDNALLDAKKKVTIESTVSNLGSIIPSNATREMCSVMMTTGGFISPAIEGRTPEVLIPDVVEKYFGLDAPPEDHPIFSQISTSPRMTEPTNPSVSFNVPLRVPIKYGDEILTNRQHTYNIDKRFLKKIKKRTSGSVLPMNKTGSALSGTIDKDQRKRIKVVQKNLTKSGVFKVKQHCSNITQLSQDKYLRKQFKHKQKQMRQQLHKQIETPLNRTNVSSTNVEADNSYKLDKHLYPTPVSFPEKEIPESKDAVRVLDSLHLSPSKQSNQVLPRAKEYESSGFIKEKEQTSLSETAILNYEEIKLNSEPDRSKLNIFKKISSGRKDRAEVLSISATHDIPSTEVLSASASANTTIFGDDQVISLPSGTTITPAPPSGSGRHVYAPPPLAQSGNSSSIVSNNNNGNVSNVSPMLMQRGDLMIHKPKKRGRKPGSKNQPKVLGLTTKKIKKKKNLFGHNSSSGMIEPLNLSHNSIANIANIPLGIASTFPIEPEAALKLKREKKKGKLGKDANFMRNTNKSASAGRNMAPTKEEFASINQKLMMMDTVLQAAPPLATNVHMGASKKTDQSAPPSFNIGNSFLLDQETAEKMRKEKKKTKVREQKQFLQGTQPLPTQMHCSKPLKGVEPKNPCSSGFPNMQNMPMFPFYPFSARPGLIPSHNIFSQLPNMQNSTLFMPSLIGFRPLNPPIRPFIKDEKELTPPLLQGNEGNYSKVAPLVPDTMKLDMSPKQPRASSPGISGAKLKSPLATPCMTKTNYTLTSGQTPDINMTQSAPSPLVNTIFGDFRKKGTDPGPIVSSSGNNSNNLANIDVTIEVSSDDSIETEVGNKHPLTLNRTSGATLTFSEGQSQIIQDNKRQDDINVIQRPDTNSILRRSKEQRRLKRHGKQKSLLKMESTSSYIKTNVDNITQMPETTCSDPEQGKKYMIETSSQGALDYKVSSERRKDHKKMRRISKDGKLKKKKDKKDKCKYKDRNEKTGKGDKSEKRKEEKKDKLKKNKKEKKKEKQRLAIYKQNEDGGPNTSTSIVVPKLTLKLGQSSQSPKHSEVEESRSSFKSSFNMQSNSGKSASGTTVYGREPSPELARISPLVTRPPKQKQAVEEANSNALGSGSFATGCNTTLPIQIVPTTCQTQSLSASTTGLVDSVIDVDSNSGGASSSMLPASATILGLGLQINSSNSLSSSTTNHVINAGLHHNENSQTQHHQVSQHSALVKQNVSTISLISETSRPSSYIDAEGNRVWICPACGKVDDGSAMIGCDGCDAWYHWICVGIFVAPNDNEDWYCRVCISKKRGIHGGDRKRKRNKKKSVNS